MKTISWEKHQPGFQSEQNPHCLVQPLKCLYFGKAHQLHKEKQILMPTVQTSSGKVRGKKSPFSCLALFFSFFFF